MVGLHVLLVKSTSEHVVKNTVFEASFDEFVLRQYTVTVRVHLGEDLPRSSAWRIIEVMLYMYVRVCY